MQLSLCFVRLTIYINSQHFTTHSSFAIVVIRSIGRTPYPWNTPLTQTTVTEWITIGNENRTKTHPASSAWLKTAPNDVFFSNTIEIIKIHVKSLLQRLQHATRHWIQTMSVSTGWSSGADLSQELCCNWWSDLPPRSNQQKRKTWPGGNSTLCVQQFPQKFLLGCLGKSAWTTTAICLKYLEIIFRNSMQAWFSLIPASHFAGETTNTRAKSVTHACDI